MFWESDVPHNNYLDNNYLGIAPRVEEVVEEWSWSYWRMPKKLDLRNLVLVYFKNFVHRCISRTGVATKVILLNKELSEQLFFLMLLDSYES